MKLWNQQSQNILIFFQVNWILWWISRPNEVFPNWWKPIPRTLKKPWSIIVRRSWPVIAKIVPVPARPVSSFYRNAWNFFHSTPTAWSSRTPFRAELTLDVMIAHSSCPLCVPWTWTLRWLSSTRDYSLFIIWKATKCPSKTSKKFLFYKLASLVL